MAQAPRNAMAQALSNAIAQAPYNASKALQMVAAEQKLLGRKINQNWQRGHNDYSALLDDNVQMHQANKLANCQILLFVILCDTYHIGTAPHFKHLQI